MEIQAVGRHPPSRQLQTTLSYTAKELLNMFYNFKMNYKDIPLNKRLYVLEDKDAAHLKDVVGERSKNKEEEN